MISKPDFKRNLALITVLLLVAGYLRFQNFSAIEHNIDRAYPLWQALQTLDHGVFPVTAQGTSVLFANPALMGYLLLPATALTRTPIAAYIFVILLNWLAVALVYSVVIRLRRAPLEAFFAAFLFAVNPWIIEYSRLTWVQGLLPFFVCLIFWLLIPVLRGTSRRPGRDLGLALVALTALTQTYLLAFAILAPIGLLIVLFRRRVFPYWRAWLPGLIVLLASTGIYALGLLNDPQTGAQLGNFAGNGWHLSDEALQHALRLISGGDYAIARGTQAPILDSALRQTFSNLAHWIIVFLTVLGIGQASYHVIKEKKSSQSALFVILLIWFALPILMMSYVPRVIHPFYLLLSLPAGHLLTAIGMRSLVMIPPQRIRLVSRFALIIGFALFGLLSALNTVRYAEQTYAQPYRFGFDALPLKSGLELGDALKTAMDNDRNAVVFADANAWILNTFAGQLFEVARTPDIEKLAFAPGSRGPARQYLYLLTKPPSSQSELARTNPTAQSAVPGSWSLLAYRWTSIREEHPLPVILTSAEGLRLSTVTASCDPATREITLRTLWTVSGEPAASRLGTLYAPYAHVFDSKGRRILIVDGQVIPGDEWRPNDSQIQMMRIILPADAQPPFRLTIGQYDGVHQKTLAFTANGQPKNTVDIVIAQLQTNCQTSP